MTSKSTGLTLLEAHNFYCWAAKNPDQLLSYEGLSNQPQLLFPIFNSGSSFVQIWSVTAELLQTLSLWGVGHINIINMVIFM